MKKKTGIQISNRDSPVMIKIQISKINVNDSPIGILMLGLILAKLIPRANSEMIVKTSTQKSAEDVWHCWVVLEQRLLTSAGSKQSRVARLIHPVGGGGAPVTMFPMIHAQSPIFEPVRKEACWITAGFFPSFV